ncbi:hypothetical protein MTO96_035299 [Rhipicephalus appendiculatus]
MSDTAGYDASCVDEWKRRLDMDKLCGMVSSKQTCWLCDDLTAWNREMRPLGLELEESRPGMFLLRCSFDTKADSEQVNTFRQASFLASWLLCHHPCIQEVNVRCPFSVNPSVEERPFQIQLRPPSSAVTTRRLRGLYISETCSARLDIRDLDVVIGLETLYINVDRINQHLAAQIDVLMEHNGATLKKVDIWEYGRTGNRLTKFESLVACECLTLMSPISEGRIPHIDTMVQLFSVSTTLKEVTAQEIYQVDLAIIAEALATNRTLEKLSLDVGKCASVVQLFRSLEVNNSLKDLSLWHYVRLSTTDAQAVASALVSNSTLTSLHMGVYDSAVGGMQQLSQALAKNCTLHSLSLEYSGIPMSEVSTLCRALRVNRAMKTLQFFIDDSTEEERTSLAQQLLADDCYDRVRLGPWTEPYLRILSPVLASPGSSAEQILLPDIDVSYLIVEVRQEPDAKVALLCEMLKKNRCIKCLSIRIQKADSAKEIWRALTANAAVNFLCISMPAAACEEATEAFSDMLSRNNAITGMSMLLKGENDLKFMDSTAKAMSRNRRIVSFSSQFDCRIYVPFSIRESVRRNQCSLNRAVEFVLNRRDDRRGAECFELFVGTPCMMTQLTTVGGIADVEARLKIVAAKHRIQDNYFVLTGIVRRHMVCWPADVKEIDALNAACWRAIASFLRLTDVCFQ